MLSDPADARSVVETAEQSGREELRSEVARIERSYPLPDKEARPTIGQHGLLESEPSVDLPQGALQLTDRGRQRAEGRVQRRGQPTERAVARYGGIRCPRRQRRPGAPMGVAGFR